jgi:hypothetical protein
MERRLDYLKSVYVELYRVKLRSNQARTALGLLHYQPSQGVVRCNVVSAFRTSLNGQRTHAATLPTSNYLSIHNILLLSATPSHRNREYNSPIFSNLVYK